MAHVSRRCRHAAAGSAGGAATVTALQRVPVQAGTRYALSGWTKCGKETEGGSPSITAWFYENARRVLKLR